ncbi:very short patch repair endonuclease [Phyllobacterium lublinensis]|uniref:very short patch repair endonuclease n=1 Tax=Phyllobacterium lublinensis TaxID=2875708 RepID=UPI001CCF0443|nr:very short patch repair endonuclease [Phyllobacterium sp. 2063]MBZ9654018.1 very short patch repair endonuclease [Phyllobacterium sp. 2063]
MDIFDPQMRSRVMSSVKRKNTSPELKVRGLLWNLGFRYRLHAAELPGKPDIVFRKRRKAIFVHGCFWHGHDNELCRKAKRPNSRRDFWDKKLDKNIARDRVNEAALIELGFSVLVLWECDLKDTRSVKARLIDFLKGEQVVAD